MNQMNKLSKITISIMKTIKQNLKKNNGCCKTKTEFFISTTIIWESMICSITSLTVSLKIYSIYFQTPILISKCQMYIGKLFSSYIY